MSTAIFQSEDVPAENKGPDPYAHLSPLQVYLAASLPLTFVTLTVWAVLHWLERHKEKMKRLKSTLQRAQASFMV